MTEGSIDRRADMSPAASEQSKCTQDSLSHLLTMPSTRLGKAFTMRDVFKPPLLAESKNSKDRLGRASSSMQSDVETRIQRMILVTLNLPSS